MNWIVERRAGWRVATEHDRQLGCRGGSAKKPLCESPPVAARRVRSGRQHGSHWVPLCTNHLLTSYSRRIEDGVVELNLNGKDVW